MQETCIFCAFHINTSFLRTSRRIHLSRRNFKPAEATASQRDQDLEPTGLFTTRYSSSNTASQSTSDNNQNDGNLYGRRYTSGALPSWKRKAAAERHQSILEQASVPNLNDASKSSRLQPPISYYHNKYQDKRPQKHYSWSRAIDLSPNRKGTELNPQFKEHQSKQRDGTLQTLKLQTLSSGSGHETQESAYKPNDNSPPTAPEQPSRGFDFRRVKISPGTFPKDEFQNLLTGNSRQRMLLDQENSDALPKVSEIRKGASNTYQGQKEQHGARWTQLTSRSKSNSEAETSAGEIVRFKPIEQYTPVHRKTEHPTTGGDAKIVDASKFRRVSLNETSQYSRNEENSSTEFYNNRRVAQDKVLQESSNASNITQKTSRDVDPKEYSGSSQLKDERRRGFWEEENSEREGKRAKSKRSKSSRKKNEENELDDEDIDVEKLERIEEKQRRKAAQKVAREDRASGQTFIVPSFISIGNLATALKIRAESFQGVLRGQGFLQMSNDHVLDAETAGLIATELGFKVVLPAKDSEIDIVAQSLPDSTNLLPSRPPVVTIMGHVDHGKTTLLDWLRNSSIAASEHGGITQHIGAFTVQMPTGRIITFLDTPGHAAFLDMRARGANVTDIVILVVAADDSVKPQTIEAIKHARAAHTQIVVAISKIDKPEADPDRVKQDLARQGIEVEDYGGDTQTVNVSGKTGEGMDKLEDAIIALADVLDVKADPLGLVEGWVLEGARTSSGKVATVLVRRGTIKPGQIIVAGRTWARIRTLRNEAGVDIEEGLPGTPVEIEGWNEQPEAGAEVLQAPNEQRARRVIDYRIGKAQIEKQAADVVALNESRKSHDEQRAREKALEAELGKGGVHLQDTQEASKPRFTEVPVIIRADVSGSVEAVNASVLALGNSEVRANVVHTAVGGVTKSDIERAVAIQGCVVNFNVALDGEIIRLAERSGIRIIDGNIIYRVVDDVKAVLEEKLPPRTLHQVTGEADVLQSFEIKLKGKKTLPVAGCRIRNGVMTKGSKVKVIRNEKEIYDGKKFLTTCIPQLTRCAQASCRL